MKRNAAVGKFAARSSGDRMTLIDGKAVAALPPGPPDVRLDRAQIAKRCLLEFEHQRWRQCAIGFEEIEALCEGGGIAERRGGDVAKHPESFVAAPISRRSTCTQRSITMWSIRPIRPAASRHADEIGRRRESDPCVAPPRHRLVEADLAQRQVTIGVR